MQTSRLYHQLQILLGQSIPWADQRHLQTLIGSIAKSEGDGTFATEPYTVCFLTANTALKQIDPEFEAVSASMSVPFYQTFWRVGYHSLYLRS